MEISLPLGFQLEDILKNRKTDNQGNPRDTMIWTLFKSDYENSSIRKTNLKAFDIIGREINF